MTDETEEIVVVFNSSKEAVKLKIGEDSEQYEVFINEKSAGIDGIERCGNIVEIKPVSCKVMLRIG